MASGDPNWLTIDQAAVQLRLSTPYALFLVRSGRLAGQRRDGTWLVEAGAVQGRALDRDGWISFAAAKQIVGCSSHTILAAAQ